MWGMGASIEEAEMLIGLSMRHLSAYLLLVLGGNEKPTVCVCVGAF